MVLGLWTMWEIDRAMSFGTQRLRPWTRIMPIMSAPASIAASAASTVRVPHILTSSGCFSGVS